MSVRFPGSRNTSRPFRTGEKTTARIATAAKPSRLAWRHRRSSSGGSGGGDEGGAGDDGWPGAGGSAVAPAAAVSKRSSVASAWSNVAVTCPSRKTTIRWHSVRSSGSSDEHRMTPYPRRARSRMQIVDLRLRRQVDSARRLVEHQQGRRREEAARQHRLLLVAAAQGRDGHARRGRLEAGLPNQRVGRVALATVVDQTEPRHPVQGARS